MFVIPIYAFTYLISLTDFLSSNQITSAEKLIYQLPSTIIGSISSVVLNIILIRKFGVIGLAFAASLTFLISHIVNIYFANRVFHLPINHIKIVKFFLFAVIVSTLIYYLMTLEIIFGIKILLKISISFLVTLIILRMSKIKISNIKNFILGY